jgi:putative serine protease PepD
MVGHMTEQFPPPHENDRTDTQRIGSAGDVPEQGYPHDAPHSADPGADYGARHAGQQGTQYGAQHGGMPGVTHRYESYGFSPQPERERSRPSKAAVAGILVAALIVGVLGGLAGAAGFALVDDLVGGDAASTASPSPGSSNAQVSDSKDPAPEPGSVEQVAAEVLPSVVKINVTSPQGAAGAGSGIILSSDGAILTNNHVVEVAEPGGRIAVHFSDGSAAPAHVVGTDPVTDLAVIQAEDVSGLTPATIGHSGQLDVGEQVVAVGSPFGLEATVTTGIVSALHRPVTVGDAQGTDTTYPAIQTDAAINPGNSGGPLVNMRGEVVGINSSIRTAPTPVGQGGSIGLGFAIPIDNVLPIVKQLRSGQEPTHAQLGITVVDATSTDGLESGAGIRTVVPGSAADKAGLQQGDVIVKVDGVETTSAQALVAAIRAHRPGGTVQLTVVTEGNDQKVVEVKLGSDSSARTT